MSFESSELALAVDRLCGDRPGRCLGAAFTTYTFDTKFFEEQVLAAALDVRADPVDDVHRFLEECRARIVEAPIVVVADAGHITVGRRVPYDLLVVDSRVFHPKLSLLLFEKSARLSVGSGNLTEGGYGGNSELFFVRELSYDAPEDRRVLRDACAFLASSFKLARSSGTQGDEFLRQVQRLCPNLDETEGADSEAAFKLVHSAIGEPLLDQVLETIPASATIARVGVLAPFFEEDGDPADPSVLMRLLQFAQGRGKGAALDVGLPWDDNPLTPQPGPTPQIDEALDQLWCVNASADALRKLDLSPRHLGADPDAGHVTVWFTPVRATAKRVFLDDEESIARDTLEALRAERLAFPIARIETFGPRGLLEEITRLAPDTEFFLFPQRRAEKGALVDRPLHAKLLVVHTREGRKDVSYVLIGSPNLSRKALLLADSAANVEAAVLLRVEDKLDILDLCDALVGCSTDALRLKERAFEPVQTNWSSLIRRATWSADARTLEVEWDLSRSAPSEALRLVYPTEPERVLHSGARSAEPVQRWTDFTLELNVAELHLYVDDLRFSVQIEVANLAALPVNPIATEFHLEELLLRFMGRWGPEKLRQQRQRATRNEVIEALVLFGEAGFQPQDVFRAWWGISRELADPLLTVGGLRVLLDGPGGVRALWDRMKQAPSLGKLSLHEIWFYGLELSRAIAEIVWPDDAVGREKRELVAQFLTAIDSDVRGMAPSPAAFPAVEVLERFYRIGGAR